MKIIKGLWVLSVLALNAVACGGDDDNKNGGNAEASAYVTSCKKLCDDQVAKSCSFLSASDCHGLCDAFGAATGDCATKLKAFGDCTAKQTDPCTAEDSCSSENQAIATACKK